jgi:hypothetical protein
VLGVFALVTALTAVFTLAKSHPGETQEGLRAEMLAQRKYIAKLENQNLFHCERKLHKRDSLALSEFEIIARRRKDKVKALRRKLNLGEDG